MKKSNLKRQVEGLLFVSGRPLSLKEISKITNSKEEDIKEVITELIEFYKSRGINILETKKFEYQMVTSNQISSIIKKFANIEERGELTKPALETLSIIAYKGPISKQEIEEIRGINSSLILRNLMVRGLIEEITDKKTGLLKYVLSAKFMKFLGITKLEELPEYEKFNNLQITGISYE